MIEDASRAAAKPPPRNVAALDILRLAAALLVVFYHIFYFSWVEPRGDGGISDAVAAPVTYLAALPFTSGGWVGVDLFFVISGFVITMSARGKSAIVFAAGRVTRLFPALLFFATLVFAIVAGEHLLPLGAAASRWLRTIVLFPRGPWIDGVIWTLTIELIFYALIFLVLLLRQPARLAFFSRCALGVFAVFWLAVFLNDAAGGRLPFGDRLDHVAMAYYARVLLISTGPFFLLGMFGYEAFSGGMTRRLALAMLAATACCLFIIGKTAMTTPAVQIYHQSPLVPVLIWLGFTVLCGVSIWIERRRDVPASFRAASRRLGLMTYPLYLVHDIPGGFVLGLLWRAGLDRWLAAGLTIFIALLVSYGFAVAVEPWLQNRLGFARLKTWARARQDGGHGGHGAPARAEITATSSI